MTIKPFPRWKDKKYDHGTHVYGYAMMVSGQADADVQAEAWRLAWFFSGYPVEHLTAGGLLQPKKDFVESPAFKNFKDIPSLDVFLEDMKKSTYHVKTTAYTEVSDALRVHMERAWREGSRRSKCNWNCSGSSAGSGCCAPDVAPVQTSALTRIRRRTNVITRTVLDLRLTSGDVFPPDGFRYTAATSVTWRHATKRVQSQPVVGRGGSGH